MMSQKFNSDVIADEARALHRVVRAIHDGNCPKCGSVRASHEMAVNYQGPDGQYRSHECPDCHFYITVDEVRAAMAAFRPFMEANVELFERWREMRNARQDDTVPIWKIEELFRIAESRCVPAKINQTVIVDGKVGVIRGGSIGYLMVRFGDDKHEMACHPTWRVQYLVGREWIKFGME